MPTAPVDQLALLQLDDDMYSLTIQPLEALYDRGATGRFIVTDAYGAIAACKQATNDFRQRRGITEPIVAVDSSSVYWRKNRAAGREHRRDATEAGF